MPTMSYTTLVRRDICGYKVPSKKIRKFFVSPFLKFISCKCYLAIERIREKICETKECKKPPLG
jgi:hypothetical protein